MYRFLLFAVMLVFASGCASNKTFIPTSQDPKGYRVPMQQQVLSDAVIAAVSKVDASGYAGKRVYVEVIGVVPHANADLLDYVADTVRSHLAVNGAQIVFPTGAESVVDPASVNYVVVAAVEMGGADQHRQSEILGFSGEKSLVGKARIRVTGYPTNGGGAITSTGQGQASRLYSSWIFWFFPLGTYYYAPFSLF